MATIASLKSITPQTLASQLLSAPSSIAIIDVRDSDHVGGHIRGSRHVPVGTHDTALPELVRTLMDTPTVVFHCSLSQQRGPRGALRYVRERSRLVPEGQRAGQEVLVLEGGFAKWQELYGEDERLTEAYQKDLWE